MSVFEKNIRLYLEGRLTDQQNAAMAEKIAQDPEFAAKVEKERSQIEEEQSTRLKNKKFNNRALLLVVILSVGGLVYSHFFRPSGNFEAALELPTSILADLENRYANDPDTLYTLPENCRSLLQSADELYQQRNYKAAEDPLFLLILDDASTCHSDAYFYLALLRLKNEDPKSAVECLTKIEDYSRFGDDIQWFMALAFVQMAEKDPTRERDVIRAMQRILNSSQSEERKAAAQKILTQYQ